MSKIKEAKFEHKVRTDEQLPKVSKYKFHDLSWAELLFYHIFYWGSVSYALYHFYLYSQANKTRLPLTQTYLFGAYQDQNDLEWNIFQPSLLEFTYFGILHLFISQILRHFIPQGLLPFYIFFSLGMLVKILGQLGALLCLCIPLVMFVALLCRSKTIIWLSWCFILITFNTERFAQLLILWLNDVPDAEFKASIIAAWIILRSLSFCLDSCNDEKTQEKMSMSSQLMILLAYCFYFPLLFTGPFMPYSSFQNGLKKPVDTWHFKRVILLFIHLSRFSFWMFVNELLLYNFYAHSHHFSPSMLTKMNSWSLGGFVYFLLIFFLVKYVVYYGMLSTLAKAEGFEPPHHPRCVLLVYQASDVWRYFDYGLYFFMTRHIYFPFVGQERSFVRKIQASVVVFIFVYVWHGASPSVFWWSVLNFFGIVVENACKGISKQSFFVQAMGHLSGRWQRRLICCFCSFGLLTSVLSLVIFLSSIQNAKIVFARISYQAFPHAALVSFLVFYCIAQCAIDIDKWRKREKSKQC